ncbi:MAG TPA: membrane protein insertion efficiency factor YidD [Candidatus Omnitrophota bacterium]|nr:membrane protein insertion efficiency factor YidD [Candidatus Omnitrophota bacterium]HPD84590.1 membrane protein insertion efficiency factor YidD [Candidatus Omnitrophota bacterium]HRZ03448.1 membrane protein insertion efficiency factor YidD [Candidatus Omnitrophota bacterium]
MTRLFCLIIMFYQKVSRFFLPPSCRFYPSCSHYAIAAVKKHGFFKGLVKSLWRIVRCSPLSPGGYDPA